MIKNNLLMVSQEGVTKEFSISSLQLNINGNDSWTKFENNSIASYRTCFFRIVEQNKNIKYFILNNVFIKNNDNIIEITYNDRFHWYFQDQKIFANEKNLINKYQKISKEKSELKALDSLNLSSYNRTEIDQLNKEYNKLKLQIDFSLVEGGQKNEEK
ncbi:MSC_0621 family F1-like ATPase epsilon subunit [[Mycoplasma] gypis]|uniref:Uncharacterized protein n=1 Tax=[Mycoplasma] gypis TaxID=92404 RepID=A0ABZ2RMQ8_9BACT|nr:hypothetical protein [[Mycoplasma] gypis]MBN0919019.1 hypothetical protein [[Mycoplasma] gypis]